MLAAEKRVCIIWCTPNLGGGQKIGDILEITLQLDFKCLETLFLLVCEKPQVVQGMSGSVLLSSCYQEGKWRNQKEKSEWSSLWNLLNRTSSGQWNLTANYGDYPWYKTQNFSECSGDTWVGRATYTHYRKSTASLRKSGSTGQSQASCLELGGTGLTEALFFLPCLHRPRGAQSPSKESSPQEGKFSLRGG